ncbi:DUF2721 domain-containing protein [Novosphingobium terrae]|uniref:DUF2721 domain-containing protein n=1 Tax=Novosphingobium terrae TaxID=2726189 RepID=UPI001982621C|nr:DUF2721 domain-containing protein [Novosphingobium terrae]
MSGYSPIAIDAAAHVVQLALTPIFLLTGIASLLNVFSTRLGRIADQVDKLVDDVQRNPRRLARLRLRSRVLDSAVLLAAIAGALTCAAAMTLFVGEIGTGSAGRLLFALFGGALACSIAALGAFSAEMILAGKGTRERAEGDAGDQ